jgi:hypothetical protein
MNDHSKVLYDLRNDLHRDIVQTASLNDVLFDGNYMFDEPVKSVVGHCVYLTEYVTKSVSIKGINNSSDMITEDEHGNRIYVRYMDVPIESLNEMLEKLKGKKFYRD